MTDDEIERLARARHQSYLDLVRSTGDLDPHRRSTHVAWDDLTPGIRLQNVHQVETFVADLRDLGYTVRRVQPDEVAQVIVLPDDVVEALAVREHNRWYALKRRQGYRWGRERVDEPRKDRRHPDFVHYEELDDKSREKDRRPMRELPADLAALGYVIESR